MRKMDLARNVSYIEKVIESCVSPENHETIDSWLETLKKAQQINLNFYEALKEQNFYQKQRKLNAKKEVVHD